MIYTAKVETNEMVLLIRKIDPGICYEPQRCLKR